MTYKMIRVGRIWHYRFQVLQERVQRSTRERFLNRAEPIAQKAYAEALVRANGGQPVPTLAELFAAWALIHKPVASDDHMRSVDSVARLHLYDLGALPINQLNTDRIELARNRHLLTHKPASANHWLRVIKLVVNWAVKRGILPYLPWKVAMLKLQKRPRAILPVDVVRTWFDAIDAAARTPSVGTAIRLMFGLGLRELEAAGARWEWIDWERATYTPGKTKGREAEPIPMPRWLVDHLLPDRQSNGLIAAKNGVRHPAGFARRVMIAANRKCYTHGITPHRLRGSFATLLSENGVPVQTIQKVMRHKSAMTTMGYLETNLGTAAIAQERIGSKIDFGRRESGEVPTSDA